MNKLLRLFKEIKLAIKLRSFYVKRVNILEIDLLPYYWRGVLSGRTYKEEMTIEKWFKINNYKFRKILKHERDEKRFGWIVWYI